MTDKLAQPATEDSGTEMSGILQPEIKRGDCLWDTRKEWYNIIVDKIREFPRRVFVGQDGRVIPCKYASLMPPDATTKGRGRG